MLHKSIIYKRKLRGFSLKLFFSFLLFLFVLGVSLGIWFFLTSRFTIVSPLPKLASTTTSIRWINEIQSLCMQENMSCHTIVIHTDQTATMTLDTGEIVILSLKKDLSSQITSLQLTIKQLTMNNKRFSRMDFRFDKPVLTY